MTPTRNQLTWQTTENLVALLNWADKVSTTEELLEKAGLPVRKSSFNSCINNWSKRPASDPRRQFVDAFRKLRKESPSGEDTISRNLTAALQAFHGSCECGNPKDADAVACPQCLKLGTGDRCRQSPVAGAELRIDEDLKARTRPANGRQPVTA